MNFSSIDDFKQTVEQLITGSNTISKSALISLIPAGVVNSWDSSWSNIQIGFKYHFDIDGTSVVIKWHSEDPDAAAKYPGCNSGSMWTAQIRVGHRLLRYDTLAWVRASCNETHIPLQQ